MMAADPDAAMPEKVMQGHDTDQGANDKQPNQSRAMINFSENMIRDAYIGEQAMNNGDMMGGYKQ